VHASRSCTDLTELAAPGAFGLALAAPATPAAADALAARPAEPALSATRLEAAPGAAPRARPPARPPGGLRSPVSAALARFTAVSLLSSLVYTGTCPSRPPPCKAQADCRAAPLRAPAPGLVAPGHAVRLGWLGGVAHHYAQEPGTLILTSALRADSDDARLPGAPPRAAAVRLGLAFNGAAAVRERCGPLLVSAAWRGCARSAWCA